MAAEGCSVLQWWVLTLILTLILTLTLTLTLTLMSAPERCYVWCTAREGRSHAFLQFCSYNTHAHIHDYTIVHARSIYIRI